MIDWLPIITSFLTLGLYTTFVCYFFYRLNEKSIDKMENRHRDDLKTIEAHWREMFMYMSGRIDNVGKGMTPDIQTQKNPP